MKRTLSLLAVMLGCLVASRCPAEPILAPDQPKPAAETSAAAPPAPPASEAATPVEAAPASEATPVEQQLLQQELSKFVGHWKLIQASEEKHVPQDGEDTPCEYVLEGDHLVLKYAYKGTSGNLKMTLDLGNPPEQGRQFVYTENNPCRHLQTSRGLYQFFHADTTADSPLRLKIGFKSNNDGKHPKSIDELGTKISVYEKIPTRLVPNGRVFRIAHGDITLALPNDKQQVFGVSRKAVGGIGLTLDANVKREPSIVAKSRVGIVQHGHQYHAFSYTHAKWVTLTLPETECPEANVSDDKIELTSPTQGKYLFTDVSGKWMTPAEVEADLVATLLATIRAQAQPAGEPAAAAEATPTPVAEAATPVEATASQPATETKVLTLKNCDPDGLVKLLNHLNPSPSFQAFGNNQGLRLVLIGTPSELATAEQTINRLQELMAQIKEGDNKLYELLKSLGTEHPDVLKLNSELEALDAEIVKLEAGLNHYVPPKRIEDFKTPPKPAPAETEAAAELAPNATSDFQLGVVLHRTKPTEAARILKLVINDDRLTAEPEGDNIVRVKYRSATKAEVEMMASVLEQMEKPDTATKSTESTPGTTPIAEPQSVPSELADASPLIGKWRVADAYGEGQNVFSGTTFEFSREGDNLFATINSDGESTVCPVILNPADDQQNHVLTIQGQDRTQQSLNMVWVYRIGLTKSQDGIERPFLFVFYSTDGTVPKTITETGKMLRQIKLVPMSPDEVVAMGLPSSAIPGRQFVVGLTAIVAIANDHKTAYAYCENNPAWVPVHLEDVQAKPIPIASGSLVAVQHGHQFHAYSTTRKAWDTLVLTADETAAYTTDGLSMTVTSPKSGSYVFKEAWGKWFSAKEIKAGKVAEHLASFDLKSLDSPSPVLPGAETPTTLLAEPHSLPPGPELIDSKLLQFEGLWVVASSRIPDEG